MNKRILKILLIISIMVMVLTVSIKPASAQETNVKIAILEFLNDSGNDAFDYLSASIQNSVATQLKLIDGIEVINPYETTKLARDLNLNMNTLSNLSTVMKFGIKTGAQILITGKYTVDRDTGDIKTGIYVYSIAQKKIIIALSNTGVLDDVFALIDVISINTKEEMVNKKKDIIVSVNEMMSDAEPPSYESEPEIKKIDADGVHIEWKTDKETLSTLYVSKNGNFNIDNTYKSYSDLSDDAINHKVIIDYDTINTSEKLYYKTTDEDFMENVISSDEKTINRETMHQKVNENYRNDIASYNKKIQTKINDKDFESAVELCDEIMEIMNKYESIINLEEEKEEIKTLKFKLSRSIEVQNTINDAEKLIEENAFEEAQSLYKEALSTIDNEELSEIFDREAIETRLNNVSVAVEINNLIVEANRYYNQEDYADARTNYEKALELIKKNGIEELIPPEEVEAKLDELPEENIPMFYLNLGGGAFTSFNGNILPSWNASFNYRLSLNFSLGMGLNLFSGEVFGKYSPLNTYSTSKDMFMELYLKPGFLVSFFPAMGIGLNTSAGYIFNFNKALGMYIDIAFAVRYYFNETPDAFEQWPKEIMLNLGLILNI